MAAAACICEKQRAVTNDAQSQLFSSDANILCYDPVFLRVREQTILTFA